MKLFFSGSAPKQPTKKAIKKAAKILKEAEKASAKASRTQGQELRKEIKSAYKNFLSDFEDLKAKQAKIEMRLKKLQEKAANRYARFSNAVEKLYPDGNVDKDLKTDLNLYMDVAKPTKNRSSK